MPPDAAVWRRVRDGGKSGQKPAEKKENHACGRQRHSAPQYEKHAGEQALKLIPRENPDLILLDYEMDGMDGKSTFEAMKEDDDMKWIPVVFLTSIADRKSIYDVLRSKPDGYILKPPDKEKIRETIEELIGEKGI